MSTQSSLSVRLMEFKLAESTPSTFSSLHVMPWQHLSQPPLSAARHSPRLAAVEYKYLAVALSNWLFSTVIVSRSPSPYTCAKRRRALWAQARRQRMDAGDADVEGVLDARDDSELVLAVAALRVRKASTWASSRSREGKATTAAIPDGRGRR